MTMKKLLVLFSIVTMLTMSGRASLAQSASGRDIHRLVDSASDYDWSTVDEILEEAIAKQAFPGCVAVVGTEEGYIYAKVERFSLH